MPDKLSSEQHPRAARAGRRPFTRTDHRARNHEEAHAGIEEADAKRMEANSAVQHPLVPMGRADLITTNEQLSSLIDHLRTIGSFAYDSEFIGELTYHPKLCLIQVASVERVALVDPLADLELRPFWELLCEPAVEKIVHAGQQDIEPVVRHLGRAPENVFDTQIAAGLAELPYPVSLLKLVHELGGARLGKGLTFTHWDQRPLSGMQLRYAADDVRYLPRVRQEIGIRLKALGHERWAQEECAAQCEPGLYGFNPDTFYQRVRGAGSLAPKNLAVLRALSIWRDEAARRQNVPPRTFLREEILLELARNPIKIIQQLERVRGLPRPVESEYGQTILELTQKSLSSDVPELPPIREYEPMPGEKFRCDGLWVAAQAICAARGLDPALVGSRSDFALLYFTMREGASSERLAELRLLSGWRREAIGDPLLQMFKGERTFALKWGDGALRARTE